jgi:alanyl aminopeptidase
VVGTLACSTRPALAQEYRLGEKVQPGQQSVYLKVDPAQDSFQGRTEIVLKVPEETSSLRFHAADISIARAELHRGERRFPLSLKAGANSIVTATAQQPIKAGTYRLRMEFAGPFNRNSVRLYKSTDEGRAYLCSQFEMTDARRCFPCFDEPGFKIPYQLTVEAPAAKGSTATHPS